MYSCVVKNLSIRNIWVSARPMNLLVCVIEKYYFVDKINDVHFDNSVISITSCNEVMLDFLLNTIWWFVTFLAERIP